MEIEGHGLCTLTSMSQITIINITFRQTSRKILIMLHCKYCKNSSKGRRSGFVWMVKKKYCLYTLACFSWEANQIDIKFHRSLRRAVIFNLTSRGQHGVFSGKKGPTATLTQKTPEVKCVDLSRGLHDPPQKTLFNTSHT